MLLRDAHDILDELRMMGHVYGEQLHVVETFSKHLEELNSKPSEKDSAHDGMLQVVTDLRKLLEERPAIQVSGRDRTQVTDDKAQEAGSLNHGHPLDGVITNDNSAADVDQPSATFIEPVPDRTLHHARDLVHEISQRGSELQKLEDNTIYVAQQVCRYVDILHPLRSRTRDALQYISFASMHVSPSTFVDISAAERPPRSQTTTSWHYRSQIRPQTC